MTQSNRLLKRGTNCDEPSAEFQASWIGGGYWDLDLVFEGSPALGTNNVCIPNVLGIHSTLIQL